jgi:3'(2'), 5'-bisphosphate nucleotidase
MDFFTQLLPIARQAGDAIMAIYSSGHSAVREKSDHSPVTEADLAAHVVLAKALGSLLPAYPVASEEDERSLVHRHGSGSFWLIDPLDGTKELIAQGRSVLGVVYAPAIDCLYWGGAGLGAFRMTAADTQVIKVSPEDANSACRVVASKSHLNDETQTFIDRLGSVDLAQAGSSLKFCRVAEGMADIYPRLAPTCEWDAAAAQAVLEGAGGVVLDQEGNPLRYGKPEVLNPSFIATRSTALIPA